MSAEDTLNPQLFHGTSASLPVGGKVLPAVKAKVTSHWGHMGGTQIASEHAFASTSEPTAWHFAQYAAQQTGGRAAVYSVDPHPDQRPGAYHLDLKEYIAPHFPVTERHDIMPGHQGTLPLNWNPHAAPQHRWDHRAGETKDFNHPAPPRPYDAELDNLGIHGDQEGHLENLRDTPSHLQPSLFGGTQGVGRSHSDDVDRARHHILRDLVNSGTTRGEVVDPGAYRPLSVGEEIRRDRRARGL